MPRTRGRMQYIAGVSRKSILVQIGGIQKPINDTNNRGIGDLLPTDAIDVLTSQPYTIPLAMEVPSGIVNWP